MSRREQGEISKDDYTSKLCREQVGISKDDYTSKLCREQVGISKDDYTSKLWSEQVGISKQTDAFQTLVNGHRVMSPKGKSLYL